jgi:hypothetical protein
LAGFSVITIGRIEVITEVINRRIFLGVSISVNVNEVARLSPTWVEGFGHADPVCCHLVLASISNAIRSAGLNYDVMYTFEAGQEYQAEANSFIDRYVLSPLGKTYYQYRGHAFIPKNDALPLQAADLLAWEWTKFRDETMEQGIRPIRNSLKALLESHPDRYIVSHCTGASLEKYLGFVRKQSFEQLREAEALRRSPFTTRPLP